MKKQYIQIFIFLIGLLSIPRLNAQVLEDYNQDWEEGERETWFSSNDRLVVDLNLETFPLASFSFEFPDHSVVFVGEKLWFFTENDTAFTQEVGAFKENFEGKEAKLMVFKEGISVEDAKVQKILSKQSALKGDQTAGLAIHKRALDRQTIRDFYIVALLISLLIIAIYKWAYPYNFSILAKPSSMLNAEDFSESGGLQKFFSLDILFYVFVVNMLLCLVLLTGLVFFRQEWVSTRIDLSFGALLTMWGFGTLFLLLLAMLKFTGIKILAFLFDLGKIEFPHFFYLLRLMMISILIMSVVSMFFLMNEFYLVKPVLELSFTGLFWFYMAGIFGLFLIMVNRLGFKKYHLFTYLCIAELVPFLILAKLMLDFGY
ncbi:DUF4271 domain-containing protein [Algoriphagus halophytocola]|uniref:DUF4271 domain-containing protein n=1 Tax=Algoriphagus halophytocola TaxID=2991499 RepID=A0ABY6MDS6_9BACT|nr:MULTISPECIES: DUF4271 domain-containing protein [unclassified Algoriphagus]UZD21927.1 DUF4271 domain-containing protein [Algoriphagus sp. TR-M5]WBL43178.1 DUF4271 domain-containing protein [Algoriphagus sp. TR-M9]